MSELEVIGIPEGQVAYPLLLSLYGPTKLGKTYFGASMPQAVLIDFPPARFGFRSVEIDKIALMRSVGEGFRSIFKPVKKDGQVNWVPKIEGFDYKKQYFFPKTYDEFQIALDKAKCFAEETDPSNGKVWVVLDDSYRWRALETLNFIEKSPKHQYPAQADFGKITQSMQSQITAIQNFANVLVIHRMAKDFNTGIMEPLIYPTNCEYVSDASLEVTKEIRDSHPVQIVKIHSNGHCFECTCKDYVSEVLEPDPVGVLAALRIPKELW
jgi:hypothetical protein